MVMNNQYGNQMMKYTINLRNLWLMMLLVNNDNNRYLHNNMIIITIQIISAVDDIFINQKENDYLRMKLFI